VQRDSTIDPATGPATEALRALDRLADGSADRAAAVMELPGLRHRAFDALDRTPGFAGWPVPATQPAPAPGPRGVPEVDVAELDAEVVRAAIQAHGCLLVRGVVDDDEATSLAAGIDATFDALAQRGDGAGPNPWYAPHDVPGNSAWPLGRHYVQQGGGVLVVDSPRMLDRVFELYEQRGLRDVVAGYLGERPVLSASKGTLRRVRPDSGSHWHQDGSFMGGGVRVLNVWLALTPCGRDAPGLDLFPKRFDGLARSGTGDAAFPYMPGRDEIERLAAETPIVRPAFEAGDALLFDELLLHSTAADPAMTGTRYAIESWFFAPSAYPDPDEQVPLVW
jgi:hypothetical protein